MHRLKSNEEYERMWLLARELRDNGLDTNSIASRIGISYRNVQRWLKRTEPPKVARVSRKEWAPNRPCLLCGVLCTHKFCGKRCQYQWNKQNGTNTGYCKHPGCVKRSTGMGLCAGHKRDMEVQKCERCEHLYSAPLGCMYCAAEQREVDRITAKNGLPEPQDKYWQQQLNYEYTEGW